MKVIFGAVIALILLGLYTYSVYIAANLALAGGGAPLTSGVILCLTTIGGLISALVIAELAVTKSNEPFGISNFGSAQAVKGSDAKVVGSISAIYVGSWILLGLAAFVIGVMLYPGRVEALTTIGQAWLGLAVAAAYAYFGLNRTNTNGL